MNYLTPGISGACLISDRIFMISAERNIIIVLVRKKNKDRVVDGTD